MLTPGPVGLPRGRSPTPYPATMRSSTRSRLSIWWAIVGVKPASDASVRTAVSSAVLRELTIHVESANAVRSASAGVPDGTPSPHPIDHNGIASRLAAGDAGARL